MADLRRHYEYSVLIDGIEANGLTLAGATIDYGTTSTVQTLEPTDARLTLISRDAAPSIADDYLGIGLGDHSKPSGFTDDYRERYEGAFTQLEVGARVVVNADPIRTGFDQVYVDTYGGSRMSQRFTGTIAAIDYTPAYVGLTCVTDLERLTRVDVGVADWPAELETARVTRIATEAGIGITVAGSSTKRVVGRKGEPAKALELLGQLATDCESLVWANRAGVITYRTEADTTGTMFVQLPKPIVLVDSLAMVQELGKVANVVTVEYGVAPTGGGGRPAVTVTDAASVAEYGRRDVKVTTELELEVDARQLANDMLAASKSPEWFMPAVEVDLAIAELDWLDDILGLDLDDVVTVDTSPLRGAPVTGYRSRVLGYAETLDPYAWRLRFSLSPNGWTMTPTGAP